MAENMQQPMPEQAPEAPQQGAKAPTSPDDPETINKALLSLGQSLNTLKAGLQDAGIPQEALAKLEEASQAYMDFLDMFGGKASAPKGPAPEATQGAKNVVPADNMAMGRKGAKPVMA